jgi:hypothetical protein
VLRRPQQEPDGLPTLNAQPPAAGGDLSWLPLAAWAPRGSRVGAGRPPIHLVPGAGTGARRCARPAPLRRAAARLCLVTGPAGGPLGVACFGTAELLAGRALVRLDARTVAGVLPDGILGVRLDTGHGLVSARSFRNVFVAHLPAGAGASVGVTLEVRMR